MIVKTVHPQEPARKWWVGKTLTCKNDRTEVTLENSDTPVEYQREFEVEGKKEYRQIVAVTCPTCGCSLELQPSAKAGNSGKQ